MIRGKIIVDCSRVVLKIEQNQREEMLFALFYGENGKVIKKLVFDLQPDSVRNLMVFQEHRTR
ncbi:MAG: hypothetical protein AAB428_01200 [Patescibacteria group bacterium]